MVQLQPGAKQEKKAGDVVSSLYIEEITRQKERIEAFSSTMDNAKVFGGGTCMLYELGNKSSSETTDPNEVIENMNDLDDMLNKA